MRRAPRSSRYSRRSRRARSLLLAAAFNAARAIALIVLIAALWRHKPYALDLLSHTLSHAALLTTLFWTAAALLAPAPRRKRRIAEGAAWTLALAATILHFSSPALTSATPPGYARVRVAAFNTYTKWNDARLAAWLEAQQVDLIAVVDPPYSLTRSVMFPEALKAHTLTRPDKLDTRLAIASRWPFERDPLVEETHHTNQRSFVAHGSVIVTTPSGARFRFAAMHPVSPRTEHSWRAALRETQREADWIAQAAADDGLPWIVGGDFNSTPASRLWRDFAARSGLRSPVTPFAQGTWPSHLTPQLALPIDRVWASPSVRFAGVTVGPRLQSDHRPILFHLDVPVPPGPPAQSDQ